ncbi:MAG: undecaprenyl-diphosphate phosphatase [Spirochaetaceae bacterium]|jgi:undecaprenyl-diphosphatase|nr:undecaprenyl-diphosphate phosphatase [Spirochaetaceae bacterium]
MKISEALILGAVQGITEFLPVSSSGHLVLLQRIFKISEPVLVFDTLVHGGTLIAVLVVLWQDIWNILRRPWQPLTGLLALATVPAVVFALVFKGPIDRAFESAAGLGFAFLITAAALGISEILSKRSGRLRDGGAMTGLDALIIGILQGIAIIPGVSRSGLTLSGALSRGLERGFAARFSFLLSIPAILGALVFQVKDLGGGPGGGGIGPGPLIAGTAAAAAVGFFSIKFMLKLVRERSLWGFAAYTALLGLLITTDQYIGHVVF